LPFQPHYPMPRLDGMPLRVLRDFLFPPRSSILPPLYPVLPPGSFIWAGHSASFLREYILPSFFPDVASRDLLLYVPRRKPVSIVPGGNPFSSYFFEYRCPLVPETRVVLVLTSLFVMARNLELSRVKLFPSFPS